MRWKVDATLRPLYPRNAPLPIAQEAGWAPEPIWTSREYLAPTGIKSPGLQSVARRYTVYAIPAPGPILSHSTDLTAVILLPPDPWQVTGYSVVG